MHWECNQDHCIFYVQIQYKVQNALCGNCNIPNGDIRETISEGRNNVIVNRRIGTKIVIEGI